MIGGKVKNGEVAQICMSGSIQKICADTVILVRAVRDGIEESDKEAAGLYEYLMKKCFEVGIVFADNDAAEKILEDAVKGQKKK